MRVIARTFGLVRRFALSYIFADTARLFSSLAFLYASLEYQLLGSILQDIFATQILNLSLHSMATSTATLIALWKSDILLMFERKTNYFDDLYVCKKKQLMTLN